MLCRYKIIGEINGEHLLQCQRVACGRKTRSNYRPGLVHTVCTADQETYTTGIILHALLQDKLGTGFKSGCACKEWLARMNEWGPGGCRENLKKIVGGLLAEAKRRQWVLDGHPILSKVAAIGTELPGGMIFARAWARKIVLEAITRSERNASENARTGSDCQG